MLKVAHLSSAHPRYDTRIFLKMCCSLSANEYNVSLIISDNEGDEIKCGVHIYDVGLAKGGRLSRMTRTVNRVFLKAKSLDAEVYHLHDPELMFVGLRLKAMGKIVIFDSHEDLPKQILGKSYLNIVFRRPLSFLFYQLERIFYRWFDAVITATPAIRDKFLVINERSVDINNYPILGELGEVEGSINWPAKKSEVCYVGAAVEQRGVKELVQAIELSGKVRMNFAGTIPDTKFEVDIKSLGGGQE